MQSNANDRLYISSVAVTGPRDLDSILTHLHCLGLDRIELSAPHPFESQSSLITRLNHWQQQGMDFLLHNYFPRPEQDFVLNIATANLVIQTQSLGLIGSALNLCAELDLRFYGCHGGYLADAEALPSGKFEFDPVTEISKGAALSNAVQFIRQVIDYYPLPQGGLLLENLFPGKTSNYSLACTPDDLTALLGEFNQDEVHLLLDLAHLKISCNCLELDWHRTLDKILDQLGGRIGCVHLSDNDGVQDDHLPLDIDGVICKSLKQVFNALSDETIFVLESRRLADSLLRDQIELISDTVN